MDTHHEDSPEQQNPGTDGPGFPRWMKWGLLGALAVVVLGYGAIFLYTKVINDSPDELGQSDLDAALAGDETDDATSDGASDDATENAEPTNAVEEPATDAADEPATEEAETIDPADTGGVDQTAAPADTAPAGTEAEPAAPADAPAGVDAWNITPASELGYRVTEVLFGVDTEAVGRTDQVEGGLTINGTQVTDAEFVVDVASIGSDESRRDNQFRGRIMSTDEFPTASFTLTEPIELGTESGEGATVETTATGDLTLRGVTNSVTFDVSARQTDGRIGVLGNIPVVFADYEIANPSVPGISTEDDGLLEFVLVFEPAA